MSLESNEDIWSRPLLPATLEAQINGTLARLAGLVAMSVAIGGLAAVILPRMPAGVLHSARPLGTLAAALADGLLAALGLTVLLWLAVVLMLGIELVAQQRLERAGLKFLMFTLSALAMAGSLAALASPAWLQLVSGLGGFVGGIVLVLSTHALGALGLRDGLSLAGALLAGLGVAGVMQVAAMSIADICVRDSWPRRRWSWSWRVPRVEATIVRDVEPPRLLSSGPERNGGRLVPVADGAGSDTGEARRLPPFGPYVPDELADPHFDPAWDDLPPLLPDGRDGLRPRADAAPLEIYHAEEDEDHRDVARSRELARRLARLSEPAGEYGSPAVAPDRLGGSGLAGAIARGRASGGYQRPSLTLLRRPVSGRSGDALTQTVQRGTARLLEGVLADFDVRGVFRSMRTGPVLATFEFEPAPGVNPSRIVGLGDDIARAMGASAARIARVPGRATLLIELPNTSRRQITMREVIETESFRNGGVALPLAVGRAISGDPVVLDLARLPHVLVAGSPHARPAMALHAMILSVVYRHGPEHCRLLLVDPHMTDLAVYMGIPHLLAPIVSDATRGLAALAWAAAEVQERTKKLETVGARSLDVFNNRVHHARRRGELAGRSVQTGFDSATGRMIVERETVQSRPLERLVVIVSELADLMTLDPRAVEDALARLSKGGAAVGIHVVVATDRASPDIVTSTLKRTLPARLCFRLGSQLDSRTVLGEPGAELLLGDGDMLIDDGASGLVRMHAAAATSEEIAAVVDALRQQGDPSYVEGLAEAVPGDEPGWVGPAVPLPTRGSADDLYECAVALVVRARSLSPALLQQRLRIDFHHAQALIDRMRRSGLVLDDV